LKNEYQILNIMKKDFLKDSLPYIAALAIIFIIVLVYFYPVLEGKKIQASDVANFKGASKEIVDYRNSTGKEPLWTNSMFGGMPAYQISVLYKGNFLTYINKLFHFGFNIPIGPVIAYFIGFLILLLVLGVNPWLSIAGALAFTFSSYFFIIIETGHNTKALAIGYMAPVLAGVILAYRGKYLWGGILTALFLALEILSNHPQITYYLLMIVLVYGIIELISAIKDHTTNKFLKASGVLFIAGILAVAANTANLWTTYEYSKYTIRTKSELTQNKENQTGGLDRDYITAWSYGIPETMTLLIPDFQGGASGGALSRNSEIYKKLEENRVPNADQIIKQMPLYWGPQLFTSGPVYVGAIVIFLFIYALFLSKGKLKWWLVAVTVLSILLSWGRHFMALTNLFIDYFPLYNKFRTVSTILVIAELTMPLLAIFALDKIMKGEVDKKAALKYLRYTAYIVGGVLLFFMIFGGSLFSFTSPNDSQSGLPDWLMDSLHADRKSIFRMDTFRSLIFMLLIFGLIWAFLAGKIKKAYFFVLLVLLIVIDMWPVDKRYLNADDFTRQSAVDNPYPMTKADQAILQDKDPDYRVYNLGEPIDQSARTSYFHKNIGGYHGAKLRRFQELVDYQLYPERGKLVDILSNKPTIPAIDSALSRMSAFNMLNTKYLIYNKDAGPLQNPYALGNAWFVKEFKVVDNADQEMAALDNFDPQRTAIIDRRYGSAVQGFTIADDPAASIKLTSYAPNHLTYNYNARTDQLAVFSEIYYDKGWNAYVDGVKKPYFRADYLLRAIVVPAGNHTLDFKFEPRSYYTGEKVSMVSSIIIILLVIGAVVYPFVRKYKKVKE
jgi:hypothetical protein